MKFSLLALCQSLNFLGICEETQDFSVNKVRKSFCELVQLFYINCHYFHAFEQVFEFFHEKLPGNKGGFLPPHESACGFEQDRKNFTIFFLSWAQSLKSGDLP